MRARRICCGRAFDGIAREKDSASRATGLVERDRATKLQASEGTDREAGPRSEFVNREVLTRSVPTRVHRHQPIFGSGFFFALLGNIHRWNQNDRSLTRAALRRRSARSPG